MQRKEAVYPGTSQEIIFFNPYIDARCQNLDAGEEDIRCVIYGLSIVQATQNIYSGVRRVLGRHLDVPLTYANSQKLHLHKP